MRTPQSVRVIECADCISAGCPGYETPCQML